MAAPRGKHVAPITIALKKYRPQGFVPARIRIRAGHTEESELPLFAVEASLVGDALMRVRDALQLSVTLTYATSDTKSCSNAKQHFAHLHARAPALCNNCAIHQWLSESRKKTV